LSAVRHNGGFTLIELVACIVIMALLAALAGPRFFNNQPFSEHGYADEVAAALRSARQVAVSSQCDVRVGLDPVTGYQVMQSSPCNGAFTIAVRLSDGNVLAAAPPTGVALAPATQIIFGGQGQVRGAAPPAITVGAIVLTVDRFSGYVTR